ncbi:MAG TPA: transcriptional regulator [Caulobacteraceae bacterium]|nr:transcriptional regulator [Caulobacteraceae bacterium]
MDNEIHIIRNDAEYDGAMAEYEAYFDAEPARGTREAERFELLGLLLARYEEETAPVSPDPVETVRLVMEGRGYDRRALVDVLGSAARASDFLNRRRDLTLEQVRRLNSAWRIPADALIGRSAAGSR